jgi:hypothetical protein
MLFLVRLPSNQVPMFDMQQFAQSNTSLKELIIGSRELLSQDQVDVLWEAIAAAELKVLEIDGCNFANDGLLGVPRWRICGSDANSSPVIQGFRRFSKIILIA